MRKVESWPVGAGRQQKMISHTLTVTVPRQPTKYPISRASQLLFWGWAIILPQTWLARVLQLKRQTDRQRGVSSRENNTALRVWSILQWLPLQQRASPGKFHTGARPWYRVVQCLRHREDQGDGTVIKSVSLCHKVSIYFHCAQFYGREFYSFSPLRDLKARDHKSRERHLPF